MGLRRRRFGRKPVPGPSALGRTLTLLLVAAVLANLPSQSFGARSTSPGLLRGTLSPTERPTAAPAVPGRAPTWQNLTAVLPNAPPGRTGAAIAFDAHDDEAVLFGGFGAGSQPLAGTWAYSNGSWSHLRTIGTPPARAGAAMTYDPIHGQVVLFGGHGASGPLSDTWTFSNGTWTNITASTGATPGKRFDAALAWDTFDQAAVLFGGRNYVGVLADTWEFANGSWVNLTGTSGGPNGTPGHRFSASLGYDPSDQALVLFGGDGSITSSGGLLGDTWWFHGNHWALPVTGASPTARAGAAVGFDGSEGALVLFGGQGSTTAVLNDTWTYSNATWNGPLTEAGAAPSPRSGASLVADSGPTPASSFVVLFGGAPSNTSLSNDTWIFGSESIVTVFVTPSPEAVDVLQNVTFSAVPVGGVAPYSFAWTGNPPPLPAGCGSPSAPTMRCAAATVGKFGVWVNVTEASGGPATAGFGFVTVTAPPAIPSLTVKPFPYHLGDGPLTIAATVTGGAHPLTFAYSGLPPGCTAANTSNLSCVPTAAGDFTVTLNVSDAAGERNSSQASIVVEGVSSKGGWTLRDSVVVGAAAAGLVVIGAGVYWWRRSRRTRPGQPPPKPLQG